MTKQKKKKTAKLGIKTIVALEAVKLGFKSPRGKKPGFYLDGWRVPDKVTSKLCDDGLIDGREPGWLTPAGELVLKAFKLGKRYG